jgi:DNA-binding MarR family transcriptional regulator
MDFSMPHQNLYLGFLQLCEQKNALINTYSAHISPNLLALFVVIARKHAQGHPMTVSEAMGLQKMASSAALHKRIDDLREAGMICLIFKHTDRRTKYLVPSDKGEKYLKLMGQLLRLTYRHQKQNKF